MATTGGWTDIPVTPLSEQQQPVGVGQARVDTTARGFGGSDSGFGHNLRQVLDPFGMLNKNTVEYGGFDTSMGFDPTLQGYGQDWMGQFDAMGQAAQQRQIDPAVYNMLMGQAQGTAPSAAQQQLMMGLERQQSMAQSLAASNPNISPALAQRLAGQQMSDMSLQTNQQLGVMRAQEQAQGQQALSQFATQQAGMNDALMMQLMSQGYTRDEAEMLAAQQAAQAELQARQADAALQVQVAQGNAGQLQSEKGGLMSAVGSAFAKSDSRLKTSISDAGVDADELLETLAAKRFRYKDERHGEGEYLGFMAQDLEKSELGRTMVFETDEGKAVDLKRVSMAALALAAHLGKRVKELEGR